MKPERLKPATPQSQDLYHRATACPIEKQIAIASSLLTVALYICSYSVFFWRNLLCGSSVVSTYSVFFSCNLLCGSRVAVLTVCFSSVTCSVDRARVASTYRVFFWCNLLCGSRVASTYRVFFWCNLLSGSISSTATDGSLKTNIMTTLSTSCKERKFGRVCTVKPL